MKLFFIFINLALSFQAFSQECQIELFSKVYRLNQGQVLQQRDLIQNSSCNNLINNKISFILSQAEGSVGSDFLTNELKKDFPEEKIIFKNKKLSLLDLHSHLKDQLLINSNLFFTQSRSLNGLLSIGLVDGEQFQVQCESCVSFGEKNLKINISNVLSNTSRTLWISSKIMAKIKVVRALRNISFQQKSLDVKDFYIDEVFTMNPENSLTTLDNIQFFKANKTILQNAVVSNQDLQALMLVNFGTPANVSLQSENISLQKIAMPIRSARFGEMVELKGPNNKNITGKVVDFNKVVIQL
jgi:flagella basal body P-ring formation protein FlgA